MVYLSLWCYTPREPTQARWPRAATAVWPICIWVCPGWFWMSELPCLASKGWTFICSIGHLYRRHASSESRVLSPIGYGTFLWFICAGVSDQCPSRSYALVWLARRRTDAWPAYNQRWSVAYSTRCPSRVWSQPCGTGNWSDQSLGCCHPASITWRRYCV